MTTLEPSAGLVLGGSGSTRRQDAVFRRVTMGAGVLVLALLAAIAVFLVLQALPALRVDQASFLTTTTWQPDATPPRFGVLALAWGSLLSSLLALVMSVPVALGVALYITVYAPRRVAGTLAYVTDMLAAVPSVVYGLWGLYFLLPNLVGFQHFLATRLGWIPIFADPNNATSVLSKSIFGASVILAIMILPIVAAISREIFAQVPSSNVEAALALGATRWEMIRLAMLRPSRPGLLSAVMLGLGRALGETIAVALVIGSSFEVKTQILTPGGNTIAANIANLFGEAGTVGRGALIASGLVLFAITLVVNLAGRAVIYRAGVTERSVV